MGDNLDAFLEDILSLPRWVKRSLALLRELDAKCEEYSEDAQRRRSRYLAMARAKLQSYSGQQVPEALYNDPELEAEAGAAGNSSREAHALMKEKVVVLNQLLRVLRGETEGFKVSLAKLAKEVGGEEMTRVARRKSDDTLGPCADRPEDLAHRIGPLAAPVHGTLVTRRTSLRGRLGLSSAPTSGSVCCKDDSGLLGPPEVPSDAVYAFSAGGAPPSSVAGTSRSRPIKKKAARSNSAAASGLDANSAIKRPHPPSAGGPAAKKHQASEASPYAGVSEDCRSQMPCAGEERIGDGGFVGISTSSPCGSSTVSTQQGLPGGRAKRFKQPPNTTLPATQPADSLMGSLSTPEVYGDQMAVGRSVRGSGNRMHKKGRDSLSVVPLGALNDAVPGQTLSAVQFEQPGLEALDRDTTSSVGQPPGVLVSLQQGLPHQQHQLLIAKTKSPAERGPTHKSTPRSPTGRPGLARTGLG
ncbi:uncharacterized protein LOC34623587 [Cyclospora cayetanensis]|uniref:Uncharacterized protein LOC34623587 n=1 Tax=Cyclospora cayetanensis TaxID=88456 RepID=A0A6P5WD00_9EIME|nr:uncharacterized protein LOC34623587 [Cyclospora cayetanensis]